MDGVKNKSLIHKTMMQYFLCTVVIFLLMAPIFYLLTKHFYAEDMIDLMESVRSGRGIPELDLERDIMAGVMLQFLLTFLILSLAIYVTIRFITRRLWQPFDNTLAKAEDYSLTQKDIPEFVRTDIKEFNRLNDSLTRLMRRSRDTYRIQREFTENASHELQTPLAVTRGKLDLLLQENLTEGQYELVADLYDLNTRMGRLNRNLLLLAKIENRQYGGTEPIMLRYFILNALPSYNLLSGGCRVVFDDRSESKSFVKANPILLECLMNNLVANAIRHTSEGDVVMRLEADDRLAVTNPGESPLDSEVIFQRFRSGDSATTGTGLGLAIVKAICEFHGWKISYHYDDADRRHTFTVTLR